MRENKYIESVGIFECITEKPEAGWFGESKEKATPFIRIRVRVLEGPYEGQVAIWQGWLTERALEHTDARLKEVFGFDGDWAALHAGKTTLAGKRCSVTTEFANYEKNGKTKTITKVKYLNPPGGRASKPMEEAKVQSLLAKLTSQAKDVARRTEPSWPTAGSDPKGSGPDDDVPF
jgi:hypothetical protein